ncbi:MAG: hypothetical protein HFJ75_08405 [Eggerthellaceae bacterium]|nr:hypothetical protein [Eggerthellaceae bacterium]
MDTVQFVKLESAVKDDGQRIEIDVVAPADAVSAAISEFYALMARVKRIDATDEEDVRRQLVELVGEGVFLDALKDFVLNRLTAAAVRQVDVDTVLAPGVHAEGDPAPGEDYAFTVSLTPRPQVTLTSVEPVHVSPSVVTVEEADIDDQVAYTAQQFAALGPADHDDLRDGDFAVMDIDMLKNGHLDKELSGVRRPVEVRAGLVPDGFIEGVAGMRAGDIRKLSFSVPTVNGADEYKADVRLWEVQQRVVPVIDDAWVADNLPQFGTVQGFRDYIRRDLESQKGLVEQQDFVYQVRRALEQRLQGFIPDEMYQQAKDSLMASTTQKLESQGSSLDEYLEQHDMAKDAFNMNVFLQASEFLRQNLALDALARARGMEATDEEIAQAKAQLPPSLAGLSDEDFAARGLRASLAERVGRDKALAWLLDTAVVEDAAAGAGE